MTKLELIGLLETALASAKCGDDEMLDRCLIELCEPEGPSFTSAELEAGVRHVGGNKDVPDYIKNFKG